MEVVREDVDNDPGCINNIIVSMESENPMAGCEDVTDIFVAMAEDKLIGAEIESAKCFYEPKDNKLAGAEVVGGEEVVDIHDALVLHKQFSLKNLCSSKWNGSSNCIEGYWYCFHCIGDEECKVVVYSSSGLIEEEVAGCLQMGVEIHQLWNFIRMDANLLASFTYACPKIGELVFWLCGRIFFFSIMATSILLGMVALVGPKLGSNVPRMTIDGIHDHLWHRLQAPVLPGAPPYTEVRIGENPSSRDLTARGDPAAPNDGERRPNKVARVDDVVSTITSDSLIILCKKFHFPNNLMVMVPKRSDRACLPPPGYLAIYETSLRVGLRFPPPLKLIDISIRYGVSLDQFLYRVMSVVVGLIALFRDRGAILMLECLSRII
ncbi:hypothetical protein IEQ34_007863 [Dendrobium chrysotoxum]|uniref:Uncharacterized protein n=1 Tax=Dendrobium chrysotoxum TaxID=161865 RepID=A0AAV7H478_DENCH|nr:hypothetical protein IEQ34_007863 [Dendrobium chrysotoxum]